MGVPVPEQSHERYERIFAEVEAPFAFVDLDAMWANAAAMLERARDKPVRVASKSVRCRALLEAILERDERFPGLMTYTLPETLWLAEQGFEDLLLAYPTADSGALGELALRSAAHPAGAPIVMVDCVEHLDAIESVLGAAAAPVRVCIDIDAGWWALGGRIKVGPKRSPVHTVEQAVALAREIERRPQIELDALMAYEGQIAGVGDRPPGRRLRGAAIRFMQRRSAAELAERRGAIVAALGEFVELEIVNGGGTGSLELTGGRGGGDRGDRRLRLLRPRPLRPLQPLQPHPRRRLRAADRPQARGQGRDRARRRLPRLRQRRPGAAAGPLAARRASSSTPRRAPARSRRRCSATPPRASRSATAPTCATPRPASSASASTPCTWSKARRSSTSSPPTAATARPSSSVEGAGRQPPRAETRSAYSLVKVRPGSSSSRARWNSAQAG